MKTRLIILSLCILVACSFKNTSTSKEDASVPLEDLLIESLRDYDQKRYGESPEALSAYSLRIVRNTMEEEGKVLAKVYHRNYTFKDGLFNEETSYMMPMEILFKKSKDGVFTGDSGDHFDLVDIRYPEDGALYEKSILEMTGGDEGLAQNLLNIEIDKKAYDGLMENLLDLSKEKGLKNYRHKLEDLPGFKEEVLYINDNPNLIDGVTKVVKKEDYERAWVNKEGDNWPYCKCLDYHEKTGIAVKGILDYFEKK